ncbi:MAG: formylglycine-generating enzyme family protein, partial [Lentisphaeria bacterium]|nr:formylglycine-generating enzyme family protein [Lentisphaeria bacterium]
LKSRPDWQSRPWKLQKGSEYEFEVTYKDGEDEYYGKIPAFTCTANGPHRKDITLTKVVFNGTVDLGNGVKLEMVKIKAGTFMMGSPENELGRRNRETRHRVTLTKDYWLGKYEVTQAQYEAIMGNNPAFFKGSNRPVEQVSWNDAKDFCRKLNERYAGKLPAGYKFDLPTEAQWEYACRAGTTTALNNGTNLTSARGACSNLDEVGWYNKNYGSNGHKEFGQKRPNNWGLYDMHGNVWEWCRDWYGSYTGDATDPLGPSSGSYRVYRGGSCNYYAESCRSAFRLSCNPGDRSISLGFRLALVPVQ